MACMYFPVVPQDAQVGRRQLPRVRELTVGQALSRPGLLCDDLPGRFGTKIDPGPTFRDDDSRVPPR